MKKISEFEGLCEAYKETMSSTEEMDVLNPDNESRHYKIGDKVKLHNGGEGSIRGIIYCLIVGNDGVDDAVLLKGSDMGEIIG
tara:strand:- start:210 stop:458 length:249 start_codon:yes stop_codon:yes gene_type:complete